jgi:hypothetical protein
MQVLYDKDGYITSYALVGTIVDGIEIADPEDADHFCEHFQAYRIRDGDLVFEAEKQEALLQSEEIDNIRQCREKECFSIINRGQLWYDKLTEEQSIELKNWYQAWLDATNTGVVPNKPAWL